jgi:sialic acid synthase SpsE
MMLVAEIGINHDGDIELAKKLVDAALESGADATKFQTITLNKDWNKYMFTEAEWWEIKRYCEDNGAIFFSTPEIDEMETVDFIDPLVPIFKIASPALTHKKFLRKIASKGKPIFLSTGSLVNEDGMATLDEVAEALSWIPDSDITILHCVSKYPCFDNHLERIDELKQFGYPVGLSDHSKETKLPPLPVIEKHFMLEGMDCVDKAVSLTPKEFKDMSNYVRGFL